MKSVQVYSLLFLALVAFQGVVAIDILGAVKDKISDVKDSVNGDKKEGEEKNEEKEESLYEGGIMQQVLHTAADGIIDRGIDIAKKNAPSGLLKPVISLAAGQAKAQVHKAINRMDDEPTTTAAPKQDRKKREVTEASAEEAAETEAPATKAAAPEAPATEATATEAAATEPAATEAAATEAAATEAPATKAPATEAPATKAPATEAPAAKAPAAAVTDASAQAKPVQAKKQGIVKKIMNMFSKSTATEAAAPAQTEAKSRPKRAADQKEEKKGGFLANLLKGFKAAPSAEPATTPAAPATTEAAPKAEEKKE